MKFSKSYRSLYPSISPSKKTQILHPKFQKATSITKLPKVAHSSQPLLTQSSNHIEISIISNDGSKYRSEALIQPKKLNDVSEVKQKAKLVKSSKKLFLNPYNKQNKSHQNVEMEITSFGRITSPTKSQKPQRWPKLTQGIQLDKETNYDQWNKKHENITAGYMKKSSRLNNQNLRIQMHILALQRGK